MKWVCCGCGEANDSSYECEECGARNTGDCVCSVCGALNDPDERCSNCGHALCEECETVEGELVDYVDFEDSLVPEIEQDH
ncbi:hypothetical protein KAV47_04945 [Candidatus Bathyarchaeota archaeon]|nr:hypothetical protein [Candidatus Bathyarchaeota archaeon]